MYVDKLLEFSDAQALTVAAASENTIDTSVLRDLGVGEPLFIVISVQTAFTDSHAITPVLQGHDDDSWGGTTTIFTFPDISAANAQIKGKRVCGVLPPSDDLWCRYIRLYYTPADTQATGKLDAFITNLAGFQYIYASGFSVA